ncbi:hypothetical protein EHQ52_17030 [Leptospira koniambonensis]|uniref:Uncharacterized protein n=2 Tax=Leptospira koniambonensis TaxID=2484950 RepID=A0A4R9J613_9LEPT|nr:hypothetical protein EHQ52_17030 [Leptospira koniambonensis]
MYISITDDDRSFFQEGFVVKFIKDDGTFWVGNFAGGFSNLKCVVEFFDTNYILVCAQGIVYIIDPNILKPIEILFSSIELILKFEDLLILHDPVNVYFLNSNFDYWDSGRISWDGIKELRIENDIIKGLSYDAMDSINEWKEFQIDIRTKEITGGSYRIYGFND